jgi:hypothetical protein
VSRNGPILDNELAGSNVISGVAIGEKEAAGFEEQNNKDE